MFASDAICLIFSISTCETVNVTGTTSVSSVVLLQGWIQHVLLIWQKGQSRTRPANATIILGFSIGVSYQNGVENLEYGLRRVEVETCGGFDTGSDLIVGNELI